MGLGYNGCSQPNMAQPYVIWTVITFLASVAAARASHVWLGSGVWPENAGLRAEATFRDKGCFSMSTGARLFRNPSTIVNS